jgi:hypothetical protein
MSIGQPVTLDARPARRACVARCGLLLRVAIGLGVLLIGAGCMRRAPDVPDAPAIAVATALPPVQTTAQALPSPTSDLTLTARDNVPAVFVSSRHGYTVTLPCCWVGMPLDPMGLEAALADLRQTPAAQAGDLLDHLQEGEPVGALELVAILPARGTGGAPAAQLTVSVLPGRGLTLDQYLEATAAELTAIANTEVQATRLDDALRPDRLPVAVIEYRTSAARPVAGLQIAFYVDDLDNLAVLTFTTDAARYAELAAAFADIARQVTLAGST